MSVDSFLQSLLHVTYIHSRVVLERLVHTYSEMCMGWGDKRLYAYCKNLLRFY